jgi:hypothetical protein
MGGAGAGEGSNHFSTHEIYLPPFIIVLVGVELDSKSRSKHGGGEVFGKVGQFIFIPAEGVYLAYVSILIPVRGKCNANGSTEEPSIFIRTASGHHTEGDLPRLQQAYPFPYIDKFAMGWVNARNTDQVLSFYFCVTEGKLVRLQFILVKSNSLREERLIRDKHRLSPLLAHSPLTPNASR